MKKCNNSNRYGLRSDIGSRLTSASDVDLVDCGGIGGTLAGNALSLCAMRATLENVLTDDAFAKMLALGRRFYEGCVNVIVKHQVPWSVVRLGARVEYCNTPPSFPAALL